MPKTEEVTTVFRHLIFKVVSPLVLVVLATECKDLSLNWLFLVLGWPMMSLETVLRLYRPSLVLWISTIFRGMVNQLYSMFLF